MKIPKVAEIAEVANVARRGKPSKKVAPERSKPKEPWAELKEKLPGVGEISINRRDMLTVWVTDQKEDGFKELLAGYNLTPERMARLEKRALFRVMRRKSLPPVAPPVQAAQPTNVKSLEWPQVEQGEIPKELREPVTDPEPAQPESELQPEEPSDSNATNWSHPPTALPVHELEVVPLEPEEPEPEGLSDDQCEDWLVRHLVAGRHLAIRGTYMMVRWLMRAKDRLPRRFQRVMSKAGIHVRVAERLLKIGSNAALLDPVNWPHLPKAERSLELAADLDVPRLIGEKRIRPDMRIQDMQRLHRKEIRREEKKQKRQEPEHKPGPVVVLLRNEHSTRCPDPTGHFKAKEYPELVTFHVKRPGTLTDGGEEEMPLVIEIEPMQMALGFFTFKVEQRYCYVSTRGLILGAEDFVMGTRFKGVEALREHLEHILPPDWEKHCSGMADRKGWKSVPSTVAGDDTTDTLLEPSATIPLPTPHLPVRQEAGLSGKRRRR